MDGATLPGGTLTAFLAMLLLRAAWHKAQAFPETTGLIASYGIVPEGREALAARGVIALEGLLLVALVLPPVLGEWQQRVARLYSRLAVESAGPQPKQRLQLVHIAEEHTRSPDECA